jgi:hypothetical protein
MNNSPAPRTLAEAERELERENVHQAMKLAMLRKDWNEATGWLKHFCAMHNAREGEPKARAS